MASTSSSSLLLILLIFSALATAALLPNTPSLPASKEHRILAELQMELEIGEAPLLSIMRNRRVPLGDRQRMCGRKLVAFVHSVCGQACDPTTSVDIATVCCATACDSDFIKSACCA